MLKKLLKYDLEYIFKVLIIFYTLVLFFGVVTRICLNIENSFLIHIIGQICSGATIGMMISILINNLMRMWARFRNNLYGDESYLTHTLPIEKKTLYLSKILAGLLSMFASIFVIGFTLFVAYYSKENMETLKNTLLLIASAYGSTTIKIVLAFLFVFFLEFSNLLQSGYTGLILGHRMNNAKIGFSVLFGFLAHIVSQIFVLLVMFIVALFNKDIMNLFVTNDTINVDMLKWVIYMAIAIYTSTLIIGYIVNVKLFKKGVNVD